MLATVGDNYVLSLVVKIVFSFQLPGDRFLNFGSQQQIPYLVLPDPETAAATFMFWGVNPVPQR